MENIRIDSGATVRRVVDCHMPDVTIAVADGAKFDLLVMCHHYIGEQHIAATLGENSELNLTIADMSNKSIKRSITVELNGGGARCELRCVALCTGDEVNENKVMVKHVAPNCTSNQIFRAVASGTSRVAFNGLIYVARGAQKTEALQQSRNILLSDTARVDTQPQLEIYADDVKCNHGAATGSFDTNAIYYMRQRGISLASARALLLEGFCREVIDAQWFDQIDDLSRSLQQRLTEL